MCTAVTFVDDNNSLYFGRNLDWSCGYGEKFVITPINYQPHSPYSAIQEIKYPVMGIGIVEDDVPLYFDCANDKGLAVAGLNFPNYAQYVSKDEAIFGDDTYVAAYEFPLWVVSQFKSLKEVRKALNTTLIVDKPINQKYPSSLLHWIIADVTGSIVVESHGSFLYIYDNPVNVLANQPDFKWHMENLRNYINVSPEVPEAIWDKKKLTAWGSGTGMHGLPGDYSSPSRFVRAAYLNAHYPDTTGGDSLRRIFDILGGVSMIPGAAKMLDGQYEQTVYTSAFDAEAGAYHYRSIESPALKTIFFKDYSVNSEQLIVV